MNKTWPRSLFAVAVLCALSGVACQASDGTTKSQEATGGADNAAGNGGSGGSGGVVVPQAAPPAFAPVTTASAMANRGSTYRSLRIGWSSGERVGGRERIGTQYRYCDDSLTCAGGWIGRRGGDCGGKSHMQERSG